MKDMVFHTKRNKLSKQIIDSKRNQRTFRTLRIKKRHYMPTGRMHRAIKSQKLYSKISQQQL